MPDPTPQKAGDASLQTYTPTTPTDWQSAPGLVDEALDELADTSAQVTDGSWTTTGTVLVAGPDGTTTIVESGVTADTSGNLSTFGDISTSAGLIVGGDITVLGTVDGVDVASLKGGTGIIVCTSTSGGGSFAFRYLADGNGVAITNADGVSASPVIAVDLDSDASMEFAGVSNQLQLENDEASPGAYKVYGTSSKGGKGWQQVGPQLFALQVWDGSASSGTNNYLYPIAVGSGVEGKGIEIPWDCSIVGITSQMIVSAYTSGDAEIQFRKWDGSESALAGVAFGLSGTDNNARTSATYAAGTHSLSAGELILCRRTITSGSMTTDDSNCTIWVQLDDPL